MMLRSLPCFGRGLLAIAAIVLVAPAVPAQRVAPPAPATYDATIRYRIRAARNERIPQFFAMTRYLESRNMREISLSGSRRLPNFRAPTGQISTHAG